MKPDFSLKTFLPLFFTQILGALNDTLFRLALIFLITYKLTVNSNNSAGDSASLVTLAVVVFTLPFFLFSATAGKLADKYPKHKVIQYNKFSEFIIMLLALVGFIFFNLYFLLFVLFLMGGQSAFFTPIKYSILPEQIQKHNLLKANGYLEGGNFMAILIGTMLAGVLVTLNINVIIIGVLLSIFAFLGWLSSWYIKPTSIQNNSIKLSFNIVKTLLNIVADTYKFKNIFFAIVASSWFWLVGAIILNQLPFVVKNLINGNENTLTFVFVLFSVGIAVGSVLCNALLKGKINIKYNGLIIFLISVLLTYAVYCGVNFTNNSNTLTLNSLLVNVYAWQIFISFFAIAVLGGIYIVPLYAIIQSTGNQSVMAQIFATNSVINALFVALGNGVVYVLLNNNVSVVNVLYLLATVNLLFAIYMVLKVNLAWVNKTLGKS